MSDGLFSTQKVDGVHVLKFDKSEVLDSYEIERLGDDIYSYLEPLHEPKVLLDMKRVKHLSSAALGMLLALRGVIERDGGRLALTNVRDDVLAIFEMTRLDTLIPIYPGTTEALKQIAA